MDLCYTEPVEPDSYYRFILIGVGSLNLNGSLKAAVIYPGRRVFSTKLGHSTRTRLHRKVMKKETKRATQQQEEVE
jgi:hypothetical protein